MLTLFLALLSLLSHSTLSQILTLPLTYNPPPNPQNPPPLNPYPQYENVLAHLRKTPPALVTDQIQNDKPFDLIRNMSECHSVAEFNLSTE